MTITDDAPTQTKATNIVTESVDVHAPISTVYNQWTLFEDFPDFMSAVQEIKQHDDVNLHWKISINGITREFDALITEQIPDEVIAWESIDGVAHTGRVVFEALDPDTTRVTAEIGWSPDGIVEKAGAALKVDERQTKGDLQRFKELVEAEDYQPKRGWREVVDDDEDDILVAT